MSPSSLKRLKRMWAFMGFWSMATPVALRMAFRMAGAPEQAGGSPSALVPKAEVGSAF